VRALVRFAWVATALLAFGLVVAWISGRAGFEWSRRGESCVRCGAQRTDTSRTFRILRIHLPLAHSVKVKTTALTESWTRYALPCHHDWALDYINNSAGLRADGSSSSLYPVLWGGRADELGEIIQRVDFGNTRSNVLCGIGSRNNLVRFVAAEALRARKGSKDTAAEKWWASNACYFAIVTNKESAITLLDKWEGEAASDLTFGIEWSRWIIEKTP
jgi:hypothetical protein